MKRSCTAGTTKTGHCITISSHRYIFMMACRLQVEINLELLLALFDDDIEIAGSLGPARILR